MVLEPDQAVFLTKGTIPRWFPDGRRLAYMAPVDGGWQIHVIDVLSGQVKHLAERTHSYDPEFPASIRRGPRAARRATVCTAVDLGYSRRHELVRLRSGQRGNRRRSLTFAPLYPKKRRLSVHHRAVDGLHERRNTPPP